LELFFDTGSSAFGLITSKKRYEKFTDKVINPVRVEVNSWGEKLTIQHKDTEKRMEIGSANLGLKRVSYVDIYASFQHFLTPFTRIGGWLGNKPFLNSKMIIDGINEEFIVIEEK